MLFQILFCCFALFAIFAVIQKRTQQDIGPRGTFFWVLFWIAGMGVVLVPNSTHRIAALFGIGRGVDFMFYISFAAVFFLLFRLHVKIEHVSRSVTKLTRMVALLEEEQKEK
jgi:hypothetical protein